jgi:hypothetical protein
MRQRSGVIHHGAQSANVNPPAAFGASDMAVRRLLRGLALPFIQILAAPKRPHRNALSDERVQYDQGIFEKSSDHHLKRLLKSLEKDHLKSRLDKSSGGRSHRSPTGYGKGYAMPFFLFF